MKYMIIERTWEGCETIGTAETLTEARQIGGEAFAEMGGEMFTEEESIEIWMGREFIETVG